MSSFIDLLVERSRAPRPRIDQELEHALFQLDTMLESLAADLQVEHYGPAVGLGSGAHVYRLVVRPHEWLIDQHVWGLRVCTALAHARWRADWTLHGASRLRKQEILRQLPDFFSGYADSIRAAGKADTNAGRRVIDLAKRFCSAPL